MKNLALKEKRNQRLQEKENFNTYKELINMKKHIY